jgi:elongator complex protein 1
MRNLIPTLSGLSRIGLAPCGPDGSDETIVSFTQPSADRIYVATDAGNVYAWAATGPSSFDDLAWDVSLGPTSPNPLLGPSSSIALTSYIIEDDAVCVACTGGELVVLYGAGGAGAEPQTELVGTFDAGIAALQWSPDGEFVALVTGEGTLVFMTRAWEVRNECRLGVVWVSTSLRSHFWCSFRLLFPLPARTARSQPF